MFITKTRSRDHLSLGSAAGFFLLLPLLAPFAIQDLCNASFSMRRR